MTQKFKDKIVKKSIKKNKEKTNWSNDQVGWFLESPITKTNDYLYKYPTNIV